MKNSTLIIFIRLIIFIGLFSFGLHYFLQYISDELDENSILLIILAMGVLAVLYLEFSKRKIKKELERQKAQCLEIGKLIFAKYPEEFEKYYNSKLKKNAKPNPELRPIDVLYNFAYKKGLILLIDWRGEDTEEELEEFVNSQIGQTLSYQETRQLREENGFESKRDGEFILRIFKAIDKDLAAINKKLLFFFSENDSYSSTVVDVEIFKKILLINKKNFHGTEKM